MESSNNLDSAPSQSPASPSLSIDSSHSTNTTVDLPVRPSAGSRTYSANSEPSSRRGEVSRPAADLLSLLDNARNMAPLPPTTTFMLPDASLRQLGQKDVDTESHRLSTSSLYSLNSNGQALKESGPSSIAGSEPDSHRKLLHVIFCSTMAGQTLTCQNPTLHHLL